SRSPQTPRAAWCALCRRRTAVFREERLDVRLGEPHRATHADVGDRSTVRQRAHGRRLLVQVRGERLDGEQRREAHATSPECGGRPELEADGRPCDQLVTSCDGKIRFSTRKRFTSKKTRKCHPNWSQNAQLVTVDPPRGG